MVRKWMSKINARNPSGSSLARSRQSGADTRSTTASFAPTQSSRNSSSRSALTPSSTTSSVTLPLNAQSEAESLQRSITAMRQIISNAERRLELLHSPRTPLLEPGRPVARIQTGDIPSLRLSNTASVASSRTINSRASTASSRSPSPTRSTSSNISSSSSSSDSDSPPTSPLSPLSPVQTSRLPPTTTRRTNTTTASSPAPTSTGAHTRPSIPSLSSLPQDTITFQVPTPPSTPGPSTPCPVPRCTKPHVRRLSLSSECPICYTGGPPSSQPASELTWCTSSCGRTVHKSCFDDWAAQCRSSHRAPNCPVCRADWARSCGCGGRSSCAVVHVERKDEDVACPICREGMERGEELEWCKDGCGKSVHKACMDTWEEHCLESRMVASCTMCRAEWSSECSC